MIGLSALAAPAGNNAITHTTATAQTTKRLTETTADNGNTNLTITPNVAVNYEPISGCRRRGGDPASRRRHLYAHSDGTGAGTGAVTVGDADAGELSASY